MSVISVVPHVEIKIDGIELSSEIVQTIQTIQVKQILSAPSQCEIQIPEAHQQFLTEVHTKVGGLIQIKIENYDKPLFYGQITAVDLVYDASVSPLVLIRAYDLLHQLRKRQPIRTHVQVNMFQLAEDLTQDLGIKIQGGETTPRTSRLFQFKQSDLHLLHEFGEKYGHYFFLNENSLQITSLEGIRVNESLTLGENLLEARFSINAETTTTSVVATGWDMQRTTPHMSTAQESDIEVNNEIRIKPGDFATDGQRTLVDHNVQNENQAELIAQKELDRHKVQQITLWGVAEGNPVLTPGASILISGVATVLEGRYVLTEVTHTIDPVKGFISEIKTNPPIIEKTNYNKNSTIGIVSQVDDPDSLARVKVTLPTYNDIETEWLEVILPGAGSNKGQLILPDVGDNVLLLMINGEPAQSVVLGGLFGEKDLPTPSVIEGGSVKRYVTQTAGEQRIFLDDAEVSINIETQTGHNICLKPESISITHDNGSFMTIADNNMSIHSETNLEIEAPGRSIVFRGRKIDFEEA
ncbi:MAG: phage baseplate assembly protein V [Methylococcaceae bacterium]